MKEFKSYQVKCSSRREKGLIWEQASRLGYTPNPCTLLSDVLLYSDGECRCTCGAAVRFSGETITLSQLCALNPEDVSVERSYLEEQSEWLTENNVKVGDCVEVVRKAKGGDSGWDNYWTSEMDRSVCSGKAYKVHKIYYNEPRGLMLAGEGETRFSFPYFCLEKLEVPEYIEELIDSTKHWDRICRGKDKFNNSESCSLCSKYLQYHCNGCPAKTCNDVSTWGKFNSYVQSHKLVSAEGEGWTRWKLGELDYEACRLAANMRDNLLEEIPSPLRYLVGELYEFSKDDDRFKPKDPLHTIRITIPSSSIEYYAGKLHSYYFEVWDAESKPVIKELHKVHSDLFGGDE